MNSSYCHKKVCQLQKKAVPLQTSVQLKAKQYESN